MKIKINDNWGIKSDGYNYYLCKIEKVEKQGEIVGQFRNKFCYSKLSHLFEGYIKYRMGGEEDLTDFEQVIELEKELLEEIKEFKGKNDVKI